MNLIQSYLSYLKSIKRFSDRTVTKYSEVLHGFQSFCAAASDEELISSLNHSVIRSYEVFLMDKEKFSARTVGLHLSVLSGLCKHLIQKGLMESNPVRLIKRPKMEKRLPVFYRKESMEQYFESTKGVAEFGDYSSKLSHLIVSFLYCTAIRRSELISLKISSLDFKRNVITVLGKGDKMREIPLVSSLSEEIILYLQTVEKIAGCERGPEEPLLITSKGGPLYPVFVDRVIKNELSRVSSITGRRSPHVLRHTLATELLDEGTDLNSIKELLGHSSLAATQVYTHNSVERLKSIYNNAHPRAKSGGKNGNPD